MRTLIIAAAFVLAISTAAARQREDAARRVIRTFEFKERRWNVPRHDGKLLHDLILRHKAQRILELGTSNGYSALWMGVAARQTGGKVVTIEIDRSRWLEAKANLRRAKLLKVVDARHGDAFKVIEKLEGDFDFVFMDVWKNDYVPFFKRLRGRLAPGGVFTAHNVCQEMEGIAEFLELVKKDPEFETRVDCTSGAGVSISVKKVASPPAP